MGVKATIRASGRYLEISRAVFPDSVKATMISASTLTAISVAAWDTAEATVLPSPTNGDGVMASDRKGALLHRHTYGGHRRDGFNRVVADGGLARQHHGVGAGHHRMRHIGDFGSSGPGALGHQLEHLGRRDGDSAGSVRLLEDLVLDERDSLEWQLNTRSPRAAVTPEDGPMMSSRFS